jgi:hypothetical protein
VLLLEVPFAKSTASTKIVLPRLAASSAVQRPLAPPPMDYIPFWVCFSFVNCSDSFIIIFVTLKFRFLSDYKYNEIK